MSDILDWLRTEERFYIAHELPGQAEPFKHAADEIERLRGTIEDAIDKMESMGLHIDNPLYNWLRASIEPGEIGLAAKITGA